ncbi:hypothetical protein FRC08_015837 [Ceratobasidium sp. 394]|nr:hypothetical protein FRC08_015837 [Ceratobasidium sp. 394]KAG9097943.1 hypothetical protein FS749_005046 [Ceratobasidium sp. UAMH 11750]
MVLGPLLGAISSSASPGAPLGGYSIRLVTIKAPPDQPFWTSQHALFLLWTLPLALHLGVGIGYYPGRLRLAQDYRQDQKEIKLQDILRILRQLEEPQGLPQ